MTTAEKVPSAEEQKVVRDKAKAKRESDYKVTKKNKQNAIDKARNLRQSRWFEEWTITGRIHNLFQADMCDLGIHVWRPKMVEGKWDNKTLVCVGQNCTATTNMKRLSIEDKMNMTKAVKVYNMWFERSAR